MKGFTAALLVWTLISPSSCSKAWPTHTACRDGNLEVLYQSCEQIYFAGPINNPGIEIPEGEYQVLLQLYNENRSTVACANATVTHS
uniref:Lymphocyte antigen 86 n=2 Tax=Ursus TaxID=9639 RepID=A0A452UWH4_URSMA